MQNIFLLLLLFCMSIPIGGQAQNYSNYRIFKDTRIINSHSVETLPKRQLDIRIAHRFGDFFGANDGWTTLYGLERAEDVMLGGEYGVTNNLTVGIYRTKGAGPLTQLMNGFLKYKIIQQSEVSPVSITAVSTASLSTMEAIEGEPSLNAFDEFAHRMMYTTQLLIARRFSDRFSLQLMPGITHRNLVEFNDVNDLYTLGGAARLQLTKVIALLTDVAIPLNGGRSPFVENRELADGTIPLGIGIEFDTGGHVFQVNFTNSRGIIESDYLTSTTSDWTNGEFRLGFTISRLFNL